MNTVTEMQVTEVAMQDPTMTDPMMFTDSAANKVKILMEKEGNPD